MDNANNGSGQPQQDSSTVEQTAQEILDLGQKASILLDNPIYNTMYSLKIQQLFAEWMVSEPKEEKKRESLYYEARGLRDITDQMEALVTEARALLEEQAFQSSPQAAEMDYLNTQGFGPVN